MKIITHSEEENLKIAEDFLAKLSPKESGATVVGLYGDLGAGKTTFTKAIAEVFKIDETITSPTFVIEKIYELPKINTAQKFSHLIHIDAYRLEKEDELVSLGWNKIISDPKNLILVEWPEKVAGIIPKHISINLSHISPNERQIDIQY